MRREYDFSKGRRNPYAAKLKRSVTIRLDESTIDYFKAMSAESEIPYQTLINLYLRECAATGRRLTMEWREPRRGSKGVRAQP
jgi:predicted DNA binding CopG/RHH family protein